MKVKRLVGKKSECSNCGRVFIIKNENQVMYCKTECEKEHDLFRNNEINIKTG